jgi:uncharacterized protein with HEPN domain
MRRDDALLLDMLLAARQICEYVAGVSLDDFRGRAMTQDAVIRQLLVLGEAAGKVSGRCKSDSPQVDWPG